MSHCFGFLYSKRLLRLSAALFFVSRFFRSALFVLAALYSLASLLLLGIQFALGGIENDLQTSRKVSV